MELRLSFVGISAPTHHEDAPYNLGDSLRTPWCNDPFKSSSAAVGGVPALRIGFLARCLPRPACGMVGWGLQCTSGLSVTIQVVTVVLLPVCNDICNQGLPY
eukprot:323123-Amphidinium_carterae.1